MKVKILILMLPLIFSANLVFAEADGESPAKGWSLGVLGAYSNSPYRGVDSEVTPFPLLSYQGPRAFLNGPHAGYRLLEYEDLTFTVLGNYRLQGYDSGDSPFLQGMSDRRGTLEAGLQAALNFGLGKIQLDWLSDLLDEHNGHELKVSLNRSFRFEKLMLIPSLEYIWQSGKLTNYYYGVTTAEATMARPAYAVHSAASLRLGLMANYSLNKHWFINGLMAIYRLPDEITESPIVSDDFISKGFLGIGYGF